MKTSSLEQYINQYLLLLVLPSLLLLFALTWQLAWPWWAIALSEALAMIYVYRLSSAIKGKTLESFQRASLQLGAIAQEDYKSLHGLNPKYTSELLRDRAFKSRRPLDLYDIYKFEAPTVWNSLPLYILDGLKIFHNSKI